MPEIRMRDEQSCDFCGSLEPRWLFAARNYKLDSEPAMDEAFGPLENTGGWLACHACCPFVQRADWNGLVRRVTANGGINPTIRAALEINADGLKKFLKDTWEQFARNRVGGAIEWKV